MMQNALCARPVSARLGLNPLSLNLSFSAFNQQISQHAVLPAPKSVVIKSTVFFMSFSFEYAASSLRMQFRKFFGRSIPPRWWCCESWRRTTSEPRHARRPAESWRKLCQLNCLFRKKMTRQFNCKNSTYLNTAAFDFFDRFVACMPCHFYHQKVVVLLLNTLHYWVLCSFICRLSSSDSHRLKYLQKRFHRLICDSNCTGDCIPSLSERRLSLSLKFLCRIMKDDHILHTHLPPQSKHGRFLLPISRTERRSNSFLLWLLRSSIYRSKGNLPLNDNFNISLTLPASFYL